MIGGAQSLTSTIVFRILVILIGFTLLIGSLLFVQLNSINDASSSSLSISSTSSSSASLIRQQTSSQQQQQQQESHPHLYPRLSHLPAFAKIPNEDVLIHQTLHENQPTIAGIAAILYRFLAELHESNQQLATATTTTATSKRRKVNRNDDNDDDDSSIIRASYFRLAHKHLVSLDKAYQGRSVFPIRTDDSIYVSIAAFREYLLADTLFSLYGSAAHPEKLFVGVIVNNCFGGDNVCTGGNQVIGKDAKGKDILSKVDGISDPNHIETFCSNETYTKYCTNGQIRVVYVNETEALGPAIARYYSSKLWGGETYYVQIDSHLHFANHWDELYIKDLKLTKSYPNSILSTYPPGFINFRQEPPFTPGTRLCKCRIRPDENYIVRVEMEGRCNENDTRPTQMAFIGAGFFFTPSEFLIDVPFDPFLPWLFMGEEIALSIRAWTHGWNIYAPRKNLIGHQYRPIKMGTPHFWESVSRLFKNRNLVDKATIQIRNRIKNMMGYPDVSTSRRATTEKHHNDDEAFDILLELDRYGLGSTRSREDYLNFAEINLVDRTCGPMKWCSEGELE